MRYVWTILALLTAVGCTASPTRTKEREAETTIAPPTGLAHVISVQVSGDPGAYQFAVGIRSPDQGCDQYADWWEVLTQEGELVYRRVLLHSHVQEQPFVRSGGPVNVDPDAVLWVRAHMHPGGYGGTAFRGSVREGFQQSELAASFAAVLETQGPLPDSCAF